VEARGISTRRTVVRLFSRLSSSSPKPSFPKHDHVYFPSRLRGGKFNGEDYANSLFVSDRPPNLNDPPKLPSYVFDLLKIAVLVLPNSLLLQIRCFQLPMKRVKVIPANSFFFARHLMEGIALQVDSLCAQVCLALWSSEKGGKNKNERQSPLPPFLTWLPVRIRRNGCHERVGREYSFEWPYSSKRTADLQNPQFIPSWNAS
jgi:hypothetical protein